MCIIQVKSVERPANGDHYACNHFKKKLLVVLSSRKDQIKLEPTFCRIYDPFG